ncbi:MAG: hypothetical protein U0133_05240 [Gemmatimonadales bacterium]
MKPQDKMALQAQLQGVTTLFTTAFSLAGAGATQPIITPTGPAAAPGLTQIAAAMSQQQAAMTQLLAIVKKIVDEA